MGMKILSLVCSSLGEPIHHLVLGIVKAAVNTLIWDGPFQSSLYHTAREVLPSICYSSNGPFGLWRCAGYRYYDYRLDLRARSDVRSNGLANHSKKIIFYT